MKGKKFFGIGIALAVCVLLLAVEAGFISVAWAKPPQPTTFYGYAILRDDVPNDKIWSDGKGRYVDNHIVGGEDYVTLKIQSGDLVRSDFKCGWPPSSTRRVLMVLSGETQVPQLGPIEEKFLNILRSQDLNNPLNPIAHLQGGVSIPQGKPPVLEYVDFIADTITRKDLWAYGILDAELTKYRFSSYTGLAYEDQHLIYGLHYVGCTVTRTGTQTWEIVPDGSPVNLFVYKKKGKSGVYEPAYLATYGSLPFGYTTSTSSLEPPPGAPRKQNTLSDTWGKIKAK